MRRPQEGHGRPRWDGYIDRKRRRKNAPWRRQIRRGKKLNNKKRKFFGKERRDKTRRNKEKKDIVFKDKKNFFRKKHIKPSGFTNNPKYLVKKTSEILSSDGERKRFTFNGKRKFKNRSSRSKKFTFKRYNKKRRQF